MTNQVIDYGWETAAGPQSCGYIAPAVLTELNRLHCARVVDIGAGNGALCGLLASRGLSPVGLEYDAGGIEIAKRTHPDIPFYKMGVEDDPSAVIEGEGLFDAAVSTEVIEHLYAPHYLPRLAATLLKPGGWLLITTPYHGYLKNLALALAGAWDKHHTVLWHGGHIKFFSRDTLSQLLASNGFEVVRFIGVGRAPYLWKSMILVARRRPEGQSEEVIFSARSNV